MIAKQTYVVHNGVDQNIFQGDLLNLCNSLNHEGTISRIGMIPGIFYVTENESQKTYGINLREIKGYRGETDKELGIRVGAPIRFRTKEDQRTVEAAEVIR